MATKLAAARLLTYWAAATKDRGARADLEAGVAKLFASEAAHEIAVAAMCILKEAATFESFTLERHYRDTPLMIIGEGTNEIQRLLIARQLLERYSEQAGPLASLEGEPEERKQMVLAVRQFVEKQVIPVVPDHEQSRRWPAELVERLQELGIFGALAPPQHGGLGLDLRTCALILEELGRGWTSIARIVTSHLALAHAVARFGTVAQRKRLLPAMARGNLIGGTALSSPVAVRRTRGAWTLRGSIPAVDNASQAAVFLVLGRISRDRTGCFLIERGAKDVRVGRARETLGGRGVAVADLHLNGARAEAGSALGGGVALAVAHLGIAATAVGLAQAAFEAALRYSQQRSTFGKPICQHQAIQLKLADMATAITTARLLVHRAASALDARDPGEIECRMAKLLAAETAYQVSLEAMRIHGGYGYTTEFLIERYYRDAPHLMLALGGPELERLELSRLLAERRADSFV